jgi:hypothetical protein
MSSLESERPVPVVAEPDKSLKPHGFQFNFIYNVALFKSAPRVFFNLIEMPDFAFISPKPDLNFPKVSIQTIPGIKQLTKGQVGHIKRVNNAAL